MTDKIKKSKLIGRKLSDEHKKNISLGLTGRKMSEKTRKKLSEANIGRKASEETLKKMSAARLGKPTNRKLLTKEEKQERAKLLARKYRLNNKEKIKSNHAKWRKNNPDKIKNWNEIHKYKKKNDPQIKEHYRLYNQQYEKSEHRLEYLRVNKDKRLESKRQYYYKNIDESKRKVLERHRKIRTEIINHYSNGTMKCNKCGESIQEFLEVDHINGGGRKHKKSENITNMYTYLKTNKFPEGYQILCANCNIEKVVLEAKLRSETGTKSQKYMYTYRQKRKLNVFSHYMTDGEIKCACPNCNENNINKLCLDHINNGGTAHRKKLLEEGFAGNNMYLWVKQNNYPPLFRILCINCNKSLGNRGYCPHDTIK